MVDRQKEKYEDNIKTNNEKQILGIRIIDAIASKVSELSSSEQIFSAAKQILIFYKLIPKEWKSTAAKIFEKLWSKKKIVMSTDPEKPAEIYETYETNFGDDRLTKLFKKVSERDKSIFILGKSMIDLIQKGLHNESESIKDTVDIRYDGRGLTIVNMITTGDIQYVLNEIDPLTDSKTILDTFNGWVDTYDSFALLISPSELIDPKKIEEKIINLSKRAKKNYVMVHVSGKIEDVNKVTEIISKMKEEKKLKYERLEPFIVDSGFYKALNAKILFS